VIVGATVWHHIYGFGVVVELDLSTICTWPLVRWDSGTEFAVPVGALRVAHKQES